MEIKKTIVLEMSEGILIKKIIRAYGIKNMLK